MSDKVLKGRRVNKGKGEGEALVSQMPIGVMMIDPQTGVFKQMGHELEGKSVVGKVLVFPIYLGGSPEAYAFLELDRCKTKPAGMISLQDTVNNCAVGVILANIPMMDKLDGNPLELIKTGDYVELDADQGIVKIRSRD